MLRTFASRSSQNLRRTNVRPFTQSAVQRVEGYPNNASTNSKTKTDMLPDDEHSVNKAKKGDTNDIQTANLKDGVEYVQQPTTHGRRYIQSNGLRRRRCVLHRYEAMCMSQYWPDG